MEYIFYTDVKILNDTWISQIRKIVHVNCAEKKHLKRSNRYMEARMLRNSKPLDVRMLIPLNWV